jgi:hypothetical protein
VSTKLKAEIKRWSASDLRQIHKEQERARELILLFSHQLSVGFHRRNRKELDQYDENGENEHWTNLKAEYLKVLVSKDYCQIRDLLIEKGVIEMDPHFKEGEFSRGYRFTEEYYSQGLSFYTFQDHFINRKLHKRRQKLLSNVRSNSITDYLFYDVYPSIQTPDRDTIYVAAESLITSGNNKWKGKELRLKGKKSRSYWLKRPEIRLVEDDYSLYRSLVDGELMIPRAGDQRSGGRVYDAFTLMPRWIRKLVTIDNEPLVSLDFSALHPNLAKMLYDPDGDPITHEEVIDFVEKETGMEQKRERIKYRNLQLFNLELHMMNDTNNIVKFYQSRHPELLKNVKDRKRQFGYKSVSQDLFTAEVRLMTEVIESLRAAGIKAIYVYDAIMVKECDVELAVDLMNQAAKNQGVTSEVKME